MKDNQLIWADSEEELKDQIPGCTPLSFTFINANVYDNPVKTSGLTRELVLNNPNFRGSLEQVILTQH